MTAAEHVAGQLDLDGKPVPAPEVARPNPSRIYLTVEINADLPPWECWPDGEPETWTVDTLGDEILEHSPSLSGFLSDWNLPGFATLRITDDRGDTTWVDLS